MKINKKIKIATCSIAGLALLLFAVLIIHIAIMVKSRLPLVNATVQMARADFKQPVDSLSAAQIQDQVKSLKGVKSTYFNSKDHILVYTYDNNQNTAQNIYDKVIKNSGFRSVRYTVSKDDLAKGCPVMGNHSFYGKLTSIMASIIN